MITFDIPRCICFFLLCLRLRHATIPKSFPFISLSPIDPSQPKIECVGSLADPPSAHDELGLGACAVASSSLSSATSESALSQIRVETVGSVRSREGGVDHPASASEDSVDDEDKAEGFVSIEATFSGERDDPVILV